MAKHLPRRGRQGPIEIRACERKCGSRSDKRYHAKAALRRVLEVIPEGEWSSVLIEEPLEVRRDSMESIALGAICVGGTSNVQYHGMLKPELQPGSSIGAAPAKLQFGAGSGELQSGEGAGKITAGLKFMGFEGGEILRAKKT
jgi:hypothetical protein